jgi:hypothetical protein
MSRLRRLICSKIPTGDITEAGMRNNISVALQYIEAWFGGRGAVAINYLMEERRYRRDFAVANLAMDPSSCHSRRWSSGNSGIVCPDS